ncbi:MAG TPA: molybdopterin-guanine dinucleotide biosynthesis protein B [Vulgatibacter sp.]
MSLRMISYDEALSLVAIHVAPLPPTACEPRQMLGCRLAAPLVAPGPLPACDDAAMDGWAIRAETTAGASREAPVWLEIGTRARESPAWLQPGSQALEISTGDPIPSGADSVVPLELARPEGDRIAVLLPVEPGANVRRQGEDVAAGRLLVPAGARVDATVALTAAALGLTTLSIHPRLRAAVLPVGDHVAAGRPDATGVAIHAALDGMGASSALLGPVAGAPEEVAALLRAAAARVDLLVTVGAASVGTGDVVPAALEAMGARKIFHGVSIKPGKPVGLWLADGSTILVLPGSPAAALACFDSIGRSVSERLAGGEPPGLLHALAGATISRRKGKTGLLRGRLVSTPGGLRFDAAEKQGPSQVSAVADTNALAVIPPQVESIAAGDALRVISLGPIPAVAREVPAVAICGLSGSGKTWLLERLIARLSEKGLRVATVKHDVHGFEADPPGKDTALHRAAGAIATALVGPARSAVVTEGEVGLPDAVRLVATAADLVLVEGFKAERTLPKIEVAARGRERVHAAPLLALVTDVPRPRVGMIHGLSRAGGEQAKEAPSARESIESTRGGAIDSQALSAEGAPVLGFGDEDLDRLAALVEALTFRGPPAGRPAPR